MELFESLEEEALLAMVDKYCSESVDNPFESDLRKFDATVINEKVNSKFAFHFRLIVSHKIRSGVL
ncbi:unnamed protein product [Brugia pahangi]|uniref:Transposase n=1 Tax=Brugia pahangi TaxID=6280 RepID=A0A0N4T5G1_BRUPA|nr:unnamed protein product [Brugia pahangi]